MADRTVLALETSCDETSAAVTQGGRVLSNIISSQARLHEEFRGVVPELASRAHMERVSGVVEAALRGAFGRRGEIRRLDRLVDAVAFTQGPGLAGALLVGKVAAQSLAWPFGLPLIGVNHLEAHALAMGLVAGLKFPLLSLVVSGGHTELVWARAPGRYRVLGRTRDDAAGEVFDKVAKFLRLGYPGGPVIDRLAREGNPAAVRFPRAALPGWDFSFSGLKTAVLYHVRDAGYAQGRVRPAVPAGKRLPRRFAADLSASFQEAVVDALIEKAAAAARKFGARQIVVGGGVAANSRLREKFAALRLGIQVLFPPMSLCTDNAAMIAYVAEQRLKRGALPRRHAVDPSMAIQSWC